MKLTHSDARWEPILTACFLALLVPLPGTSQIQRVAKATVGTTSLHQATCYTTDSNSFGCRPATSGLPTNSSFEVLALSTNSSRELLGWVPGDTSPGTVLTKGIGPAGVPPMDGGWESFTNRLHRIQIRLDCPTSGYG